MTTDTAERWTRRVGLGVVHRDSDDHALLVARTLGIEAADWLATLDRYAACVAADSDLEERLAALREAFVPAAPYAAELPELAARPCACCGSGEVRPCVARRAPSSLLVYGRCRNCGHGSLLSGAAPDGTYLMADYYRRRSSDGSGYDHYESERPYREAKAERLLDWLLGSGTRPRSLLEVGSGFGYGLQAASRRGLLVKGVDVNPEAERAARELYGVETAVGTLESALASGAVAAGAWDVVVYQFVLEHVADPRVELRHAGRALAPGGRLLLVVPSMAAFELDVFAASYRSLRSDHLHLFTEASLRAYLEQSGFRLVRLESHCNLHLLRGFFAPSELAELYTSGRGPDLTVLAERSAS